MIPFFFVFLLVQFYFLGGFINFCSSASQVRRNNFGWGHGLGGVNDDTFWDSRLDS